MCTGGRGGGAPLGKYRVEVVNFCYNTSDTAPYQYTIKVKMNDQVKFYNGTLSHCYERQTVCEFVYHGKKNNSSDMKEEVAKYEKYSDEVILGEWKKLLAEERILILNQPKVIVDVMLGTVALT